MIHGDPRRTLNQADPFCNGPDDVLARAPRHGECPEHARLARQPSHYVHHRHLDLAMLLQARKDLIEHPDSAVCAPPTIPGRLWLLGDCHPWVAFRTAARWAFVLGDEGYVLGFGAVCGRMHLDPDRVARLLWRELTTARREVVAQVLKGESCRQVVQAMQSSVLKRALRRVA